MGDATMTNNEAKVLSALYDITMEWGASTFEMLEEECEFTIKQLRGIVINLQKKGKLVVKILSHDLTWIVLEDCEHPYDFYSEEEWANLKQKALGA
jgi:hypothetical protein